MNLNAQLREPGGQWVVVLLFGDRSGISGIWGPYASQTDAHRAVTELKTWPIDGNLWEVVKLKHFPHPATGPYQIGDHNTQTNICR